MSNGPIMGVVHPAHGPGMPQTVRPLTSTAQELTELRVFVQDLADDWKREGTSGDAPGIARAAFELLERLRAKPPVMP